MGKFLEGMGWCLIVLPILASAAAQSMVNVRLPLIVILPWALTAMISGIFIIAFGVGIQHLAAIRSSTERQESYLREIAKRDAAKNATY